MRSGRHAGGAGLVVFAHRHHVDPRPQIGHQPHHGEIGIGLHRVADKVIHPGKRLVEEAIVPGQRGHRIAVERRAHLGRDVGQGHVLGVQDAVAIKEVVHYFTGAERRKR